MAELLRASPSDVVPVVNATAAVNTVLACTQLERGDLIMTTSITYNAVCSWCLILGLSGQRHDHAHVSVMFLQSNLIMTQPPPTTQPRLNTLDQQQPSCCLDV